MAYRYANGEGEGDDPRSLCRGCVCPRLMIENRDFSLSRRAVVMSLAREAISPRRETAGRTGSFFLLFKKYYTGCTRWVSPPLKSFFSIWWATCSHVLKSRKISIFPAFHIFIFFAFYVRKIVCTFFFLMAPYVFDVVGLLLMSRSSWRSLIRCWIRLDISSNPTLPETYSVIWKSQKWLWCFYVKSIFRDLRMWKRAVQC